MNFSISNQHLTVVVSDLGAQLQSILGSDGTEYLWQGDPTYWSDRALNIFPYVARLTEGSYYLDGQLYHMNIHGFAPYSTFSCAENTENRLILELFSNTETRSQYPREFTFRIIYELIGSALNISYKVTNQDSKTMYFGLGGHPGFNVPLENGKTFEDYQLRFSAAGTPKRVGFTEDCFLNGADLPYPLENDTILKLHHDLFDNDAIVLKDMTHEVTLEPVNGGHSITVSYPDMSYLGLWHWPKTDAPYICIEPWSSLPATKDQITVFEEQKDLITLPAGKTYTTVWSIHLH